MAKYIDKNILSQAYFHVEIDDRFSEAQLEVLKSHFVEYLKTRGSFFIHPDVDVEVEFKEGSLKAYLTVVGFLYLAIGQYGSFRSGIDYLYIDAKRFSESVVAEGLFQTKSKNEDVKRAKSRTGIIGKLKDLVNEMKGLEDSLGRSSIPQVSERIENLIENTNKLIKYVKSIEDQNAVEEEIRKTGEALPETPPFPKDKKNQRQEKLRPIVIFEKG